MENKNTNDDSDNSNLNNENENKNDNNTNTVENTEEEISTNTLENTKETDVDEKRQPKQKTGLLKRSNPLSNNIFLIAIAVLVIIFIVIIVLFSEGFRVKRVVSSFKVYNRYQTIRNYNYKAKGHNILGNHFIASSYNSCNVKNPILSYMNCNDILKGILQSGARYIEFKIFNDKFGVRNIEPVVNNGFEIGEWKLCFNSVNFEDVCKVIKTHAFTINKKIGDGNIEGVPNPNDPLFISLDLKTRNNVGTLNRLTRHITTYLSNYLLPRKYNYNNNFNLLNMKMRDLEDNIVLFCSNGYQGSDLESVINGSWEEGGNINRVFWEDLDKLGKDDKEDFKEKFKKKLTIVTPDPNLDLVGNLKIIGKKNYDTKIAFDLGCHFVSVYYQSMDKYMNTYITKFRNNAIVLKPDELHIPKSGRRETTDDGEEDEDVKTFNYSDYRKKLQEAAVLLENLDID
jgi:hypothetical protein